MPKNLQYPSAAFPKALELAQAVDSLGGSAGIEMVAEKMGKKVSGGFNMLISAGQKFHLVENNKGKLAVTETFKLIKFGYTDAEKLAVKRKSFLTPPMFAELYARFLGRELPVSHFDKLLIREYGLDESFASRIAGYFIDGLKGLGLLDAGNVVQDHSGSSVVEEKVEEVPDNKLLTYPVQPAPQPAQNNSSGHSNYEIIPEDGYTIHVYGPGTNIKQELMVEEDFEMLEVMLRKVKRLVLGSNNKKTTESLGAQSG